MTGTKFTVTVQVSVLDMDTAPSMLCKAAEQIAAQMVEGELCANDGDEVSWETVKEEVELMMTRFAREVISVKQEWKERPHHFGSLNKKLKIREITYELKCGHTIVRTRAGGADPLSRKFVHCIWCESGEDPQTGTVDVN